MNQNWPTREKDLQTARFIMEEYAHERDGNSLGLFEIVVDIREKRMNFCLSAWVLVLAKHFTSLYGLDQGEFITRRIITNCIVQDQIMH